MSSSSIMWLGVFSMLPVLLLTVALITIVIRTGHGIVWILLSLVPLVTKIAMTYLSPFLLVNSDISPFQGAFLYQLSGVIFALLFILIAFKQWPISLVDDTEK